MSGRRARGGARARTSALAVSWPAPLGIPSVTTTLKLWLRAARSSVASTACDAPCVSTTTPSRRKRPPIAAIALRLRALSSAKRAPRWMRSERAASKSGKSSDVRVT